MKPYSVIIATFFMNHVNGQQKYKEYVNHLVSFSIKYPNHWEFIENPKTAFIFRRPPTQSDKHSFLENANLIISQSANMDLEQYAKNTHHQLSSHLTGYKEENATNMTINGIRYHRIIYIYNMNNTSMKVVYYLTILKGKAFNFTYTSTELTYNNFKSTFDYMINSFKLLN